MHSSTQNLLDKLVEVKHIIPGDIYYHYRNPEKLYEIICVALNEEDEDTVVVYRSQEIDGLTWARRLSVWSEDVEHNGRMVPRFSKYVKTEHSNR